MQNTPFTLAQAIDVCEDFEDLIGTSPGIGGIKNLVEAVIYCPYEDALKQEFIKNYRLSGGNHEQALDGYNGEDYDVIILFKPTSPSDAVIYYGIRNYVSEMGFRYNYPE